MTAFAAVLHKRGAPPALAGIPEVLSTLTGRAASSIMHGQCALVQAPLHANDPIAPFETPSGEIAAGTLISDNLEYAFVGWNRQAQALRCARDGLGIRLLYVADAPDAIIVTNVLGAALCYPGMSADLDAAALIAFLAHGGAVDEIRTCYRDIKVLPPGHTLTIDAQSGDAQLRRHWHFPLSDGIRRTDDEILEEYRSSLATAVRDRLDPAGTSIFLSGGIDSTTMAAAATAVAAPHTLHAITTRYPRYVDDNELPFTRAAADRLGLPLAVIDADRHDPWHVDPSDPPLTSPLDEPMLGDWRDALACAARHGTAALYGEDGDALLRPPGWQPLRRAASLTEIGIAAARYALTERKRPYVGLRWRERTGIVRPRGRAVPVWLNAAGRTALDRREPGSILGCSPEPLPAHPTRPEAQAILTSTTISRHFAATIAPETTRRPIELRFPLLDTRLIRLVVSVPSIPWCQQKTLPRRAFRGRLPDQILNRPKSPLIGFNEGLVAAWRRSGGYVIPRPSDPIARWIDVEAWTRAMQSGTPEAVMAAWRVGALCAWLAGRSPRSENAPCTR
jgi:asparagine synthase (glutamine-hydrolysing)